MVDGETNKQDKSIDELDAVFTPEFDFGGGWWLYDIGNLFILVLMDNLSIMQRILYHTPFQTAMLVNLHQYPRENMEWQKTLTTKKDRMFGINVSGIMDHG